MFLRIILSVLLTSSPAAQDVASADEATLISRGNQAAALAREGELDQAEREYRAVIADAQQTLGPENP